MKNAIRWIGMVAPLVMLMAAIGCNDTSKWKNDQEEMQDRGTRTTAPETAQPPSNSETNGPRTEPGTPSTGVQPTERNPTEPVAPPATPPGGAEAPGQPPVEPAPLARPETPTPAPLARPGTAEPAPLAPLVTPPQVLPPATMPAEHEDHAVEHDTQSTQVEVGPASAPTAPAETNK